MEKRLSKEWTVNAFNNESGEFVEALNRSWEYQHEPEELQELLVTQAPPIRITPSKRKRPEYDYLERVATVGDLHFPFTNEKRLALLEVALQEISPTRIDLLGDNLDFANYSRFETRKEWADSSQEGIDQYASFLGRLACNHVDVELVWHEGNHDQRMEKRIREYNEDLLGIKPAGEQREALSLEFLLHLDELGVRMSKGYPSAREVVHDQLEIYHGHVTGSGLAASKVINTAFMSFNTGHTHNLGIVAKTFHYGNEERTIYGAESGTFADPNRIPSGKYAPGQQARHNWHSGVIDWIITEDEALPTMHTITDNGLRIGDKLYKS